MSKRDDLEHSTKKRRLEGLGHEFRGEMTGDRGQAAKGKLKQAAALAQEALGDAAEKVGRKLKK